LRATLFVAQLLGREHQRPPVVGMARQRHFRRRDATMVKGPAVEAQGRSDDVWSASQLSPPQAFADNDDCGVADDIRLHERAAGAWHHAEHEKKRPRDVGTLEPLRVAMASQVRRRRIHGRGNREDTAAGVMSW